MFTQRDRPQLLGAHVPAWHAPIATGFPMAIAPLLTASAAAKGYFRSSRYLAPWSRTTLSGLHARRPDSAEVFCRWTRARKKSRLPTTGIEPVQYKIFSLALYQLSYGGSRRHSVA